jgi:hypothetical protein
MKCYIRISAKQETGVRWNVTRFFQNNLPLLSIFSLRDDYRMKDPARKVMLLAPTLGRRPLKEKTCLNIWSLVTCPTTLTRPA